MRGHEYLPHRSRGAVRSGRELTDGQLDVVVVGDLKVWELLRYYRAAQAQAHHSLPKVHTFRVRELRVEASRRLNVHLGEKALLTTPSP